jgi:hypothetical protein
VTPLLKIVGHCSVHQENFIKMPKKAKKAWRKKIDLEDLYEGLERTKQELAKG